MGEQSDFDEQLNGHLGEPTCVYCEDGEPCSRHEQPSLAENGPGPGCRYCGEPRVSERHDRAVRGWHGYVGPLTTPAQPVDVCPVCGQAGNHFCTAPDSTEWPGWRAAQAKPPVTVEPVDPDQPSGERATDPYDILRIIRSELAVAWKGGVTPRRALERIDAIVSEALEGKP